MSLWLVHVRATTWMASSMPTVEQLEAALSSVHLAPPNDPDAARYGRWIGPLSRITRPYRVAYSQVDIARPYEFPDEAFLQSANAPASSHGNIFFDQLVYWITGNLQTLGLTVDNVGIAPFNEQTNGPVSFWTSGQAAQTATRNENPAPLSAEENPTGPTVPGVTTPPSIGSNLGRQISGALSQIGTPTGLLILAGVLGVGYYLWTTRKPRRSAQNPREGWIKALQDEPERHTRYVQSVSRRQRKAAEEHGWEDPYECKDVLVGQLVPGRQGGKITACATPTEKSPRLTRMWIGDPAHGRSLSKSAIRARMKRAQLGTETELPMDIYQAVKYQRTARYPLPSPIGSPVPHVPGGSRCSPSHRLWGREYQEALRDAQAEAAQRVEAPEAELDVPAFDAGDFEVPFANPEAYGSTDYDQAVLQALSRHPKFPEWQAQTQKCMAGSERLERSQKTQRGSAQQQRARYIADAKARGVDTSDPLFKEQLWQEFGGSERSRPKREAGILTRGVPKPRGSKGRGLATFKVGNR